MDRERSSRKRGRSVETRDQDESPLGEKWEGEYDDVENDKLRESKHRSKEKTRSSRREGKDHRSGDRKRSKVSEAFIERDRESKGSVKDGGRDRRKEDGDGRDKKRGRDKVREKENDRERYRERGSDKGKERIGKKEKEKTNDREKDRDTHGNGDRNREMERDKVTRKQHVESHDGTKDSGKDVVDSDSEEGQYKDTSKHGTGSHRDRDDNNTFKNEAKTDGEHGGSQPSASELEDRIKRMKEERMKKELEDPSYILAWDNQGDVEDEPLACQHTSSDLVGFKVLDGFDKVIEGGAVVLTLKDQSILADGDINEEIDMLENAEIGEQKRRNEAYKAAKKKIGVYDDKFNEDPGFEKKLLLQYDDPVVNEGVVLAERGCFSGEAEEKLKELRKRIDGASVTTRFEDLTSTGKVSTDYYTSEEMMKFKKPKKKKALRKKDKLDIEALEAEARSAGLGAGDRGSRADGKRQAQKEKQERSEAEMRSNAFQSAYIKAAEASRALQMEQTVAVQNEDEDTLVFVDDDEDLCKSLQRARRVALKQQDDGPQAIALLASSTSRKADAENVELQENESQENKVVFTEMEEFVYGLQLDEEAHNPDAEDVFMEEDVAPPSSDQELKGKDGVWEEVKDTIQDEKMADEPQDVKPDDTIHESSLGKGLAGALQLLKERGTLKDTVEWGGRNMDKKKSKLVGLVTENDDKKEIRIERTDERGRTLTYKEAFRLFSHKFHNMGPGKKNKKSGCANTTRSRR